MILPIPTPPHVQWDRANILQVSLILLHCCCGFVAVLLGISMQTSAIDFCLFLCNLRRLYNSEVKELLDMHVDICRKGKKASSCT